MHGAGFQGRWKVAQTLLKAGLDTSDRHMDGYTPLHRACWGTRKGHTQTVRVLLDHGVDIEEMDERGRTCLHMTQNDGMAATHKVGSGYGAGFTLSRFDNSS